MRMWKTGGYLKTIEPVEVIRKTEKMIVIQEMRFNGTQRERRTAIRSSYDNYFDTFEEAKAFLIEREKNRLESAQEAAKRATDSIMKLNAMTEPTP